MVSEVGIVRAHRRVTLRSKRWLSTPTIVRLYIEGYPAARGYLDDEGRVQWAYLYDVPELFEVVETESGEVGTIFLGYGDPERD